MSRIMKGWMAIAVLFACVVADFAWSQVHSDVVQRLRAGREMEQAGQWDQAVEIYRALHDQDPNNLVAFMRLKNAFIRTERYEEALALIDDRMARFGRDPSLIIAGGQVMYKMGRHEEARKIWKGIVAQHPLNSAVIQGAASAMIGERLFDEAIDVYLKSRERLQRPDIFSFNLASLYGARMEYGNATDELILYLMSNPAHQSIVESQILRYPKEGKTAEEILSRLGSSVALHPSHAGLRTVLAGHLLRMGEYGPALEAVKEAARLSPEKRGEALFRFARKAFQAGASVEACLAYETIAALYPEFPGLDQAMLGRAESLEAQSRHSEAIEAYQAVADQFHPKPLAVQALFRKGMIQKEQFQLNEAANTFRMLAAQYPRMKEAEESRLNLAACTMLQGRLEEAETTYREAMSHQEPGGLRIRAQLGLASTVYYSGRMKEALVLLDSLVKAASPEVMKDPAFNDALSRKMWIEAHFQEAPEALARFAKAEWHGARRDYHRSAAIYDTLLTAPEHALAERILMNKGEMEIAQGAYRQGLDTFQRLRDGFANSLSADQAQERIGWIHEKQGEKTEALLAYEALLTDYPHSFLADEVRRRIRRIESEME